MFDEEMRAPFGRVLRVAQSVLVVTFTLALAFVAATLVATTFVAAPFIATVLVAGTFGTLLLVPALRLARRTVIAAPALRLAGRMPAGFLVVLLHGDIT